MHDKLVIVGVSEDEGGVDEFRRSHDAMCYPIVTRRRGAAGARRAGASQTWRTEWTLRTLGASDPAPATPKVTLRFESGRFVGNSGCNRYTAAVTARDRPGSIGVSPGASTRMACAPLAMDLESRFLRQLQAVTGYTFVAGQLALEYNVDAKYGAMRFDAAP
jgi:heat shock protein HslJ